MFYPGHGTKKKYIRLKESFVPANNLFCVNAFHCFLFLIFFPLSPCMPEHILVKNSLNFHFAEPVLYHVSLSQLINSAPRIQDTPMSIRKYLKYPKANVEKPHQQLPSISANITSTPNAERKHCYQLKFPSGQQMAIPLRNCLPANSKRCQKDRPSPNTNWTRKPKQTTAGNSISLESRRSLA